MPETQLTDRQIETAKDTIDHVEFNDDPMQVIVHSTDYGITIYQHFDVEVKIDRTSSRPLLAPTTP